jgi:hypothetical protein
MRPIWRRRAPRALARGRRGARDVPATCPRRAREVPAARRCVTRVRHAGCMRHGRPTRRVATRDGLTRRERGARRTRDRRARAAISARMRCECGANAPFCGASGPALLTVTLRALRTSSRARRATPRGSPGDDARFVTIYPQPADSGHVTCRARVHPDTREAHRPPRDHTPDRPLDHTPCTAARAAARAGRAAPPPDPTRRAGRGAAERATPRRRRGRHPGRDAAPGALGTRARRTRGAPAAGARPRRRRARHRQHAALAARDTRSTQDAAPAARTTRPPQDAAPAARRRAPRAPPRPARRPVVRTHTGGAHADG